MDHSASGLEVGHPERTSATQPAHQRRAARTTRLIRWLAGLWPPFAAFIGSRVLVLGVLYVAPVLQPGYVRSSFFSDWDAAHYLYIAQSGYPKFRQPHGGYDAHVAFFPLLSGLIRGVHDLVGLPYRSVGIALANLSALVAFCLIWKLVREMVNQPTATATVALLAFWPASFTLSMVYPDGLLLALAAGYLLALNRQRWWLAFVVGVAAGLSKPDAVVLGICGIWIAVAALHSRRSWLPWLAAAGPPVGFATYMIYLWATQGSPTTWFTAERRGWHSSFDFGARWWSDALVAAHHPTSRFDLTAATLAGIVGLALLSWMIAIKLPPVLTIYAAGVLVMALGSGYGGAIPRLAMGAFPSSSLRRRSCGRWQSPCWSACLQVLWCSSCSWWS